MNAPACVPAAGSTSRADHLTRSILQGIHRPRISNSGLQRGFTCARLDRSGTLGFRASRRLRDPCRRPPSPAWAARM